MDIETRCLRDEHRRFALAFEPNFVLTLGGGLSVSAITYERSASHFFNAVQRADRGTEWHKQPARRWPRAVGFHEGQSTSPHLHVAAWLPADLEAAFLQAGPKWRGIRRGGHYYCTRIFGDPAAYVSYITKRFGLSDSRERVFHYGRSADR